MPTYDPLTLTLHLLGQYLSSGHECDPVELPILLRETHIVMRELCDGKTQRSLSSELRAALLTPAVPVEESVAHDRVRCLECGATMQTLKRHLQAAHGMSVEEYRMKWRLGTDHLLTAPAYSERRSALAIESGLGGSRKHAA